MLTSTLFGRDNQLASAMGLSSMYELDLTFPSPAENIACDEALLNLGEERTDFEVLRFWEPAAYFVVLGYANEHKRETKLEACLARNVPIIRRCTGGGTVLQGPGCLNYSLVLQIKDRPELQSISNTNALVMTRHQSALASVLSRPVEREGCTDLVAEGRKFSGNAQRRRLNCLLFHGTFLLSGFDVGAVEEFLAAPSREPDYRQHRTHRDFMVTLNAAAAEIKEALKQTWNANEPLKAIPVEAIDTLVRARYNSEVWNRKF